jgi:hypothetical protein
MTGSHRTESRSLSRGNGGPRAAAVRHCLKPWEVGGNGAKLKASSAQRILKVLREVVNKVRVDPSSSPPQATATHPTYMVRQDRRRRMARGSRCKRPVFVLGSSRLRSTIGGARGSLFGRPRTLTDGLVEQANDGLPRSVGARTA